MGELSIKELIPKEGKYTFLVGAGSSITPPSCLPSGYDMMKALILHLCIESEQDRILRYIDEGKLRFEALIEEIHYYKAPSLFYKIERSFSFLNYISRVHSLILPLILILLVY